MTILPRKVCDRNFCKKGRGPKLSPDWEGPYTVVSRINDVVYRIQRELKTKMKTVHLDLLIMYNSDIVDVSDRDDDDSSSMMAAGWRSLKKILEAELAMGIPERPRSQRI
mgnify:FL=1